MIDRGALSGRPGGSMQGEVGQDAVHAQSPFWPMAPATRKTPPTRELDAYFLKAHGWRAGRGYQTGEPNFAAHPGLECRRVYQKAIALWAGKIDGRRRVGGPQPK
jgi:hypothetical protein